MQAPSFNPDMDELIGLAFRARCGEVSALAELRFYLERMEEPEIMVGTLANALRTGNH